MSGKGSHKWAQGQTQPLKYDVGLRRPRRKWHRPALANSVSGKRVGSTGRVERKTIHGKNTKQKTRHNNVPFLAHPLRLYRRITIQSTHVLAGGVTLHVKINPSCSKTRMCDQSHQHSRDLSIGVRGTPLCLMLIHPAGLWKTPRNPKWN